MENFTLTTLDIGIMIAYAILIIIYGLSKAKRGNSEEYFLAGRNMIWPIVGISLFAANISSTTLIGLAGDAYSGSIAVYNYEWMAAVVLVIFGIFFMPFYLKSGVYTMPEFLERRFDVRSRYYFSFITVVGNVIIDTAAGLYAGNLILKILFPEIDSIILIICLALLAAAYTIPGGLSSVVHTEVIQAVLLIIGSILLTYFSFAHPDVGGWSGLMEGLENQFQAGKLPNPPDEVLSLVRPIDDEGMPWTGLLFGVPLLGFYFWANNQFMVQRVLSAKDLNHGRWGALFAGLLKLPVLFIMVFPGLAAVILFADLDISSLNYQIADGSTCTRLADCPNMSYPVLIFQLLPQGVLGLVVAGILAALSSSISATLNSASTLITMDFVNKFRPNMTSKQLVRTGQIATVILVILAAAWAPQIEKFRSLFQYLQLILTFIAPPIVAAFITGLFYKRANGQGAFAGLMAGFVIGAILMTARVLADSYGPESIPAIFTYFNSIHFLHLAPILLIICLLVIIGVSHATAAPDPEKVASLTWTRKFYQEETEELRGLPWFKNFRVLSVILLILTAIIVVMFW